MTILEGRPPRPAAAPAIAPAAAPAGAPLPDGHGPALRLYPAGARTLRTALAILLAAAVLTATTPAPGATPAAPGASGTAASPQPAIEQAMLTDEAMHAFAGVALSPDGRRAAWIEHEHGTAGKTVIVVAEIPGPASALGNPGGAAAASPGTAGATTATSPGTPGEPAATSSGTPGEPAATSPGTRGRGAAASPGPSGKAAAASRASAGAPAAPGQRRIDPGGDAVTDLAWSPDGRRLAYLAAPPPGARHTASAARQARGAAHTATTAAAPTAASLPPPAPGQLQLLIADLSAGSAAGPHGAPRPAGGGGGARATVVTDLRGQLSSPTWSPDGTAVALLYIAGREASADPTTAAPRDAGAVGEKPDEQRLAVVDLATGAVHDASPPDLFVYDFGWSPDGTALTGVAAHGSGEDNWWLAELYIFDRATGAARSLLKPSYQMANPRWSPDGRTIAFIGGLMSDQGVTGGDVYAVAANPAAQPAPAGAAAARNLTPDWRASATSLTFTAAGQLLVEELVDGGAGLARLDLADSATPAHPAHPAAPAGPAILTPLWQRAIALRHFAVSRDGAVAAAELSAFDRAPEVWAGPVAAAPPDAAAAPGGASPADLGWRRLSHRNDSLHPAWGAVRSLHWPSDSGAGVQAQGWLLAPPAGVATGEPGRRAALVVMVHGGPSSEHQAAWPRLAGTLASQGFYVLLPNPRGSYGFGEAYTRGNVKDFGYGDLRDILAGVDAALAAAPIDPARIGITGWSYGGFMVMWAVTQTDCFHAAVAGAGVSNWQSYYGENLIDQWMIPFFGASVYDDPWIYARSSPMTFIKAAHTPTLLLQGERDAEVPAPQAYEFWHALRTLGVETRLVIYPDEGHHPRAASSFDSVLRTIDWLQTHLR